MRYSGTDSSDTMVHRQCNDGTDSYAIVVQIRRYCHYRLSCLQRCISFESYIKPQPVHAIPKKQYVVYLLNPTSNHNHGSAFRPIASVVYLLNPTSNHNRHQTYSRRTYVVYLLNPTSNHNTTDHYSLTSTLYIF